RRHSRWLKDHARSRSARWRRHEAVAIARSGSKINRTVGDASCFSKSGGRGTARRETPEPKRIESGAGETLSGTRPETGDANCLTNVVNANDNRNRNYIADRPAN